MYAFIRQRGYDPEPSKDLTQELFARLLEQEFLQIVDREKGRFRSFLLACVRHLLSNERKKERSIKRGGQYAFVSLDQTLAENQYGAEPASPSTPETLFERRWALTLLHQTLEGLRQEYAQAGKGPQFDAFEAYLSGSKEAGASYAEIGRQLQLSEGAARQAAYRMRCRFGELLREEVAKTVSQPAEVEAELAHLLAVVSG